MTVEEYYAAVRRMNLHPTNVPTVYRTPGGDLYNVPLGSGLSATGRAEMIEILKRELGLTP